MTTRDAFRRKWRRPLAIAGIVGALVGGAIPVQSVAFSATYPYSLINGVSCLSATSCTGAGYYHPRSGGFDETLLESWNGADWSIVPSPSQGTRLNYLNGVSCASAISCTAVGFYIDHVDRTLIESWDGTSWSVVPSENQGAGDNSLLGVSCVSENFCMAIGQYFNHGSRLWETLIESWDGSAWMITSSRTDSPGNSLLRTVSCLSAVSCTAVGDYVGTSGTHQTLIESWDGSSWSVLPSPDEGRNNNFLRGVSCVSALSCTAVGDYIDSIGVHHNLIESWNGTAWAVASSPGEGTGNNFLWAVSCFSANSCTAVGHYQDAIGAGRSGPARTLIESWDGTLWSVVTSPNDGKTTNFLKGVSCVSASFCTAVGHHVLRSGTYQPLIESWDGTTWSIGT